LRRDAVGAGYPRPHEIDAAARDDERFEFIGAQIREQFMHRLVGALVIRAMKPRMTGRAHPRPYRGLKLVDGHAGMRDGQHVEQPLLAGGAKFLHIAGKNQVEWLFLFPFRMVLGARLDAVKRKDHLEVHRLLAPQRAVVVECRDAQMRGHILGCGLVCRLVDERDDGLLHRSCIP
jgi:hypothetical protein